MSEDHEERNREGPGGDHGARERAPVSAAGVGKRTLVGGIERPSNGTAPQLEGGSIRLPEGLRAGGGEPLPGPIHARLAGAAGASLGGVRIHQGAESDAASAALGARAFAVGQDIHFGAGEYDPSSPQGMHLLAHEVAHTVQQGGAGQPQLKEIAVSQPGDAHEVQADQFADAVVAGASPPSIQAASQGLAIARYAESAPAPAVPTTSGTTIAVDPSSGGYAGPEEAVRIGGVVRSREQKAAELSTPRVTVALGGHPPDFMSRSGQEYEGTETGGRNSYVQQRFHLLDALVWDMNLAETPAEVASIRWAYAERPFGRATPPRTYRDGDGQEQPFDFKLPDGAAGHVLPLGVDLRDLSDNDETLVTATYVLALDKRRRQVPDLDVMVRPERREPGGEPAGPQADKRRGRRRKDPRIVLHLPSQKAPHLGRYQNLVAKGEIVSPRGYDRKSDIRPDRNWLANVGPGKRFPIDPTLAAEAQAMGKSQKLVSIPDWTRTALDVAMQVDHIVELQVVRDQDAYDDFRNYELLDESSNMTSGIQLRHNVRRERERLAREEGDLDYLKKEIVFTEVVLDGGAAGERWSLQEIKRAEHIVALAGLLGVRPSRKRPT